MQEIQHRQLGSINRNKWDYNVSIYQCSVAQALYLNIACPSSCLYYRGRNRMEVKNTWALETDCQKHILVPVLNQLCDLGQIT